MKKPDFRLWDGKKMRYNAIVGNGQALYIPDGLGEYKWVNLAEVVAMEKTDFVVKKPYRLVGPSNGK